MLGREAGAGQGGERGGEGRGDSFVVLTGGLGRINILAEVEMSLDEDGDRVQEAAGGRGGPAGQMLNLSQRPEMTSPREPTPTNSAHRKCTPDQASYSPAYNRRLRAPRKGFFQKSYDLEQ